MRYEQRSHEAPQLTTTASHPSVEPASIWRHSETAKCDYVASRLHLLTTPTRTPKVRLPIPRPPASACPGLGSLSGTATGNTAGVHSSSETTSCKLRTTNRPSHIGHAMQVCHSRCLLRDSDAHTTRMHSMFTTTADQSTASW